MRRFKGKVNDASGNTIPILGKANARIITSADSLDTQVLVYKKTAYVDYEVSLGMNVLKHTTINFDSKEIEFSLKRPQQPKPKNATGAIILTVPGSPCKEKIAGESGGVGQGRTYIATVPTMGMPEAEQKGHLIDLD